MHLRLCSFRFTAISTAISCFRGSQPVLGSPMPSDPGPRMRTRRDLLKGCASALIAPLALRVRLAEANDLRVGAPAPPATLVTLDGQRTSTTQLIGQVVIVTFWATWCEPCREELPLLSRYADRHADAG